MFRAFAIVAVVGAAAAAQAPSPVDPLFEQFFAAESPAAAAAIGEQLAKTVDFDTAFARLKQGRAYLDEKRGEYSLRWRSKAGPFFNNVVDVPADYDPKQAIEAIHLSPPGATPVTPRSVDDAPRLAVRCSKRRRPCASPSQPSL